MPTFNRPAMNRQLLAQKVLDFVNSVHTADTIVAEIKDDPDFGRKKSSKGITLRTARNILAARGRKPGDRFEDLAEIWQVRGMGPSREHNVLYTFDPPSEGRAWRILEFFNSAESATVISEKIKDDPIYRPWRNGVGVRLRLAKRIIAEREKLSEKSFPSLRTIEEIPGLGRDSWHDILNTFNEGYCNTWSLYVKDAEDGSPIQGGALLELLEEDPGYREEVMFSGFLNFELPRPGKYKVTVSAYGYISRSSTIEVLECGDPVRDVIRVGKAKLSLDLSFTDIRTGIGIPDTYVVLKRYASSGGDDVLDTVTGTADMEGAVSFEDLTAGFWQVDKVYRNGFESADLPPREYLEGVHPMQFKMKSPLSRIELKVSGYDPTAGSQPSPTSCDGRGGAVGPLRDVIVEYEILHPFRSFPEPIDEPRNDLTNPGGKMVITDLAPAKYRIALRKSGYSTRTFEVDIYPPKEGPWKSVVDLARTLQLRRTAVEVQVITPQYKWPEMTTGAKVMLQQLGTSRDGIKNEKGYDAMIRRCDLTDQGGMVTFEKLLPGPYRLKVSHTYVEDIPLISMGTFSTSLSPISTFGSGRDHGSDIGELISLDTERLQVRFEEFEETVFIEVGITNHLIAPIEAEPVSLTGRIETQFARRPDRSRTYLPCVDALVEAVPHVEWNYLEPPQDLDFDFTDEDGRYHLQVLPGVYGLRMPWAFGYTPEGAPMDARIGSASPGRTGGAATYRMGAEWPYPDAPVGTPGTRPLVLSSGHYDLPGLRLAPKTTDVVIVLHPDGDRDPLQIQAITHRISSSNGDLLNQMKATLRGTPIGEVSEMVISYGPPIILREPPLLQFSGLRPGKYTVTFEHPYSKIDPVTVDVPDWPLPGMGLPISEGVPMARAAGEIGMHEAVFAAYPDTEKMETITVFHHHWVAEDDMYVKSPVETVPSYIQPVGSEEIFLVTVAKMPVQGIAKKWIYDGKKFHSTSFSMYHGGPSAGKITGGEDPPFPKIPIHCQAFNIQHPEQRLKDVVFKFIDTDTSVPFSVTTGEAGKAIADPVWGYAFTDQDSSDWLLHVLNSPGYLPDKKIFLVELGMVRGANLTGTITGWEGKPLPGVEITVRWRRKSVGSSQTLVTLQSDLDGKVREMDDAIHLQPIEVEYRRLGYRPLRKTIPMPESVPPGTTYKFDLSVRLQPIPAPEAVARSPRVRIDRGGMVLQGIATDQLTKYNPRRLLDYLPGDPLTATATATVMRPLLQNDSDDLDGGESSPVEGHDRFREWLLINERLLVLTIRTELGLHFPLERLEAVVASLSPDEKGRVFAALKTQDPSSLIGTELKPLVIPQFIHNGNKLPNDEKDEDGRLYSQFEFTIRLEQLPLGQYQFWLATNTFGGAVGIDKGGYYKHAPPITVIRPAAFFRDVFNFLLLYPPTMDKFWENLKRKRRPGSGKHGKRKPNWMPPAPLTKLNGPRCARMRTTFERRNVMPSK